MTLRYAVGIDLGTTHCAMARIDLLAEEAATEVVSVRVNDDKFVKVRELRAGGMIAAFAFFVLASLAGALGGFGM